MTVAASGGKAAILASFVLCALLIGFGTLSWLDMIGAQSQAKEVCVTAEDRERIRGLMLQSIDEGLKQQTLHMYEVWMKDNTEQPSRAIHGLQVGILAYIRSRAAALRWNPPQC